MTQEDSRIQRLAFWGIPLSFGVMGLKLVAWWVTGSVVHLARRAKVQAA